MALPTGTMTLMFTDIEGSTRLLTALGGRYPEVLADHRRILRAAVATAGGVEVDTQGDAFFVAFGAADAALAAAVATQRALARHSWPGTTRLLVRIGLHTGTPTRTDEGYVGIDLHRGARICAAGHGGQVVLSRATQEALSRKGQAGVELRPLGAHRLKDLDEPLTLFDLRIDGLRSSFPPLRSIGSRPTNLPSERQELIGRETELATARRLVLDAPPRLVTFTGPGGIGKTTLALRLAADLLASHPDGAFIVLLAPVTSPDRVAEAIAAALNLREQNGRTFDDVLRDYLAGREMLLVLDNFEHVVDAAPLIADLLGGAPKLRVLVTSRSALRLGAEIVFPVPPLAVTSSKSPGLTAHQQLPAALELFMRRAQAAEPGFQADSDNTRAIEEICVRLDGLPLAIELAATRVRLMSPTAMVARLERPLELAAHGPRHVAARQRTLRATIDWSHDLLSQDEKRVFAGLGVFAGPFMIEAAEYVCAADLDDFAGLLDHSLLRPGDHGARLNGRLGMLETIGVYARDRLQVSGTLEQVRQRHAAWFSNLVRPTTRQLLDGSQEGLLPRFDAEQNDLRSVLDWLIKSGRGDDALRLASDLAIFWDTRGQYSEGRARLEQALASAVNPSDRDRSAALFSLGRLALIQRDLACARPALDESLGMCRALGDVRGVMLCLSHLGWVRSFEPGGQQDAVSLGEKALEVARTSNDPWSHAVALNNLANSLSLDDDQERIRARTLLRESLQIRRELGEKRTLAITLSNFGRLAVAENHLADAEEMLEEALSLAIGLGFEQIVVETREGLAQIAFLNGDHDRAQSLLIDNLDRIERLGDPFSQAVTRFGLSCIAEARGDTANALIHREAAHRLTSAAGLHIKPFDRWEFC